MESIKNAKFLGMFYRCNISNLNSIKTWNISDKIEKEIIKYDDY